MRQPGSILLVSCYELGHQPFAISSPVGLLERAGFLPDVLDLSVTAFHREKIQRAKFIGLSVPMHTALRLAVRAAKQIREINPTCHICFYGIYASLNSNYLLEHFADSVIGGEFEEPLLKLIESLIDRSVHGDLPELGGVSSHQKSQPPYMERLKFAPPSFSGLPTLSNYAHLVCNGIHRLAGYIEGSRGCLHHCRHCPIPPVYNGRFFVVSESVVLDGIRTLVAAGAEHITFGDPDFLNGPGHSLRIVRAMHDEFPSITFDFTAKVEHLRKQRELLPDLRDAGCLFVVSAFESIDDAILKNLDKGHSRQHIFDVLEVFRKVDITIRPTWVPFTPWTTIDDYIDLLEFICEQQLVPNIDPVQYTVRLLVPPASLLLREEEIKPYLGDLDQANFSHLWSHPDMRMDALQRNVSTTVERLIESRTPNVVIFDRVRELAYSIRGESAPRLQNDSLSAVEPPRLTESWFC